MKLFVIIILFLTGTYSCLAQNTDYKDSFCFQKNDRLTVYMVNVLQDIIQSSYRNVVIIDDITYDVKEFNDYFIKYCFVDYDPLSLVIQQEENGKLSILLNGDLIHFNQVNIETTMKGYPFEIEGTIDCLSANFYIIKDEGNLLALIKASPMNWTGLMSAKYSLFMLIDFSSKVGIQTIAES